MKSNTPIIGPDVASTGTKAEKKELAPASHPLIFFPSPLDRSSYYPSFLFIFHFPTPVLF